MIILIVLLWYLIGCVGGSWLAHKIHPVITVKDALFFLTFGGIGGLITFCIGLSCLEWGKKKLF